MEGLGQGRECDQGRVAASSFYLAQVLEGDIGTFG
jgi:hypothetical protein